MNDNTTEQNSAQRPETVELQISKIVTGGAGLSRHDGMTVFVPLTAPGDRITARFTMQKKKFAQAEIVEILEGGEDRREAPCPHYGQCGGCDLQHLDEAAQRRIKTEIVADCFQRLGKLDVSEFIQPPREDSPARGTRNRVRLFANAAGHYGQRRRGSHEVVPLESCLLLPEIFDDQILPWLRFLPPVEEMVLRLDGQGGWLLSIYGPPARQKMLRKMLSSSPGGEPSVPGCVGILFNNLPIWGRNYLLYEVGGVRFRVSAQAFFQSNLEVTEFAIEQVRQWLDELAAAGTLGPLLGDLYCGAGLFSLTLADRFEKIVALDIDEHAVRDAQNNVQHCEAAAGKTTVRAGQLAVAVRDPALASAGEWAAGCVVVDPPRVGLGKDGTQSLLSIKPRHIVYMSCDPATLARDTAALVAGGYEVKKVQVLDMFPQTAHVETLVLLTSE